MTNVTRNGKGHKMTNGQGMTVFDVDLRAHLTTRRWDQVSAHALEVALYDSDADVWAEEAKCKNRMLYWQRRYYLETGKHWTPKVNDGGDGTLAGRLELWYRKWEPAGLQPKRYAETLPEAATRIQTLPVAAQAQRERGVS